MIIIALSNGIGWSVSAATTASDVPIPAGPGIWLACAAAAACFFGLAVVTLGAALVSWFAIRPDQGSAKRPPVSVLRPLYGAEPGLDAALASLCAQRYPSFQIVFGVQDAADPALCAVQRLRALHPAIDIVVAIDPALHGLNRKVGNLINMLPLARHDILVFSDSDLHVAPDYLDRLVSALDAPGTGLVTALCTGRPTVPGLAARLGAMQMTHCFLPSALLSRALGRQDCLGTTMALRRHTLEQVGGLHALASHLADDNVLGQLVRRLGLRVGLATTVPAAGVPEGSLARLWQHELRWARTIRALEPACFAGSALQFPIPWAVLACMCSGGAAWSMELAAVAWVVRVLAMGVVNRMLDQPAGATSWGQVDFWVMAALSPLRDVLSIGQVVASFFGGKVLWRGHVMRADNGRSGHPLQEPYIWVDAQL